MDFKDGGNVIDQKFLQKPHLFHAIDKIEGSNWDHAGLWVGCGGGVLVFLSIWLLYVCISKTWNNTEQAYQYVYSEIHSNLVNKLYTNQEEERIISFQKSFLLFFNRKNVNIQLLYCNI